MMAGRPIAWSSSSSQQLTNWQSREKMPRIVAKRIGQRRKNPQANPRKRGFQCVDDENLFTTPSKSRRCETESVVRDKTHNVVGDEGINDIRLLLEDMTEELGAEVTGSYILSKVADLLKLAFDTTDDLRQAIDTLAKEYLCLEPINMAVSPDEGSIEPTTLLANSPLGASTIVPANVAPVRYNPEIFHYSQYNPVNTLPLKGSTGQSNLC